MFERILSIIDNAKYYFISMVGGLLMLSLSLYLTYSLDIRSLNTLNKVYQAFGHESTIRIPFAFGLLLAVLSVVLFCLLCLKTFKTLHEYMYVIIIVSFMINLFMALLSFYSLWVYLKVFFNNIANKCRSAWFHVRFVC